VRDWGAGADSYKNPPAPAFLFEGAGPWAPATTHYLTTALDAAAEAGAPIVILRLDTPGGLMAATRDIVQAIRSSPVPVATWVAPEGARAASAGTYILYASHVAAMAPATNVGAATPVTIGGGSPAESTPGGLGAQPDSSIDNKGDGTSDEPELADGAMDAHKRKAINDAAAWIRALAQATDRNADWAEKAVRQAASLTARRAVEKDVADFMASSIEELLAKADGCTIEVEGRSITLDTLGLAVKRRAPDWRSELLAVITNPTVAYLLLMIGIYGLLFEGLNPGAFVPGTIGAIALLLALYAFQILPVNYAGLLLIALGIVLIVSEAFVPSFGALGIGGVIAMTIGSIILMDTDVPGFTIDMTAIAVMALLASGVMFAIVAFAVRAWRIPVTSGGKELIGARGEAIDAVDSKRGRILVMGENWQARSEHLIPAGSAVRVVERNGLVVRVEPESTLEE
jgi:membrane-bound serine protease (ClpP class)